MMWFPLVPVAIVFVVILALGARRRSSLDVSGLMASPATQDGADVTVLKIGVDDKTGAFVREQLARIAPGAPKDRLREAGIVLRRVRDAWLYGGAVNEPMRAVPEAMATFEQHVAAARASTGDGTLVVVSIAVVARGELVTVSSIGAGEELRRALEAASYRDDLLAVEIVVAPRGTDGMYPIQGGLAGKVLCNHCGGPFPAELVSCPHCGAPAPGRDRRAA
jgi:uncharacterized membrane protein